MPTAAAIAANAGGNLAPATPGLILAASGGNLSPATPGLTLAASGGNLSPATPGLTLAASGGNLSPAVPGSISGPAEPVNTITISGCTGGGTPLNRVIAQNGTLNGKPRYQEIIFPPSYPAVYWNDGTWYMIAVAPVDINPPAAYYTAVSNAATPDLVSSWEPGGTATGTPVVVLA